MIRGLIGVVPHHRVEPGRFYIAPGYSQGPVLFQCVQTTEPLDDGFRQKALFLTVGGKPEVAFYGLPDQSPVVALDDVHVRVDPTSIRANGFTSSLYRGLFLVRDDEAILCAPTDPVRGWQAVNMSTGRVLVGHEGSNWLSFTRWSVVMDDEEGDKLTLASFGEDEAPTP